MCHVRFSFSVLLFLCGVIAAFSLTQAAGSESPAPVRNLVVAGGGSLGAGIYQELFSLSGSTDPRVLVIPHASDPENRYSRGEQMRSLFQSLGITTVDVLDLAGTRESVITQIEAAEAIWMPGGSQSLLIRALADAGVVEAIRERVAAGVPIGGTSAGAAVMSHLMLAGGTDSPLMFHGLGVWPEVIVDQHFTERNRLERSETVIREFPQYTGVGIDESTAVVVEGNDIRIAGSNTVTILRAVAGGPGLETEVLASGETRTLSDAGPASLDRVVLHDWRFEDPFNTQLSQTLNSANPSVSWQGNLASSATNGGGVFRIRRNGSGISRRADVSESVRHDELRMTVEIAGWDLRHTAGAAPEIRFEFMNGMSADAPSEITAGFRFRREGGAVTLQAIANGTATPGAEQSEAMLLFGLHQTEKLTVVTIYDRGRDRYEVKYRADDGEWVKFFDGNTSGVRQALSFRMWVTGDFDGNGNNFFDLDRFAVSTEPGGLAARNIPTGEGYFHYLFSGRNVVVPVWTYLPPDAPEDPPIVIVCHGMGRNARGNRNSWTAHADRHGFLVISPEFTEEAFPGSRYYNLGFMYTASGNLNPHSVWSFQVIEDLFDEVLVRMNSSRESYRLYGHSAGSQFVHRMLFYMPALRVDRAVMANAGWYTMPTIEIDYPHGLRNSSAPGARIAGRLQQRHMVLLGTEDTDPNDPSLSTTPASMEQGPHRFARGNLFYDTAEATAAHFGVDLGWSLGYAPGVGHSNAGMAAYAANWLFSDWAGRAGLLYNVPEQAYEQDFATGLPADADDTASWMDNVVFPGVFVQFEDGATPDTYRLNNGSAPGTIQHWRAQNSATTGFLGGRPDDTTGDIHYGLRLTNNTSRTLFGFTLHYQGVQFFNSHSGVADTIDFAWRIGLTEDLTDGTWIGEPALTFEAPHAGDGVSSPLNLNPNLSANRRTVGPVSVDGLIWASGEDLWLRWTHPNPSGLSHGLGIDNIVLTATAEAPEAPATLPVPILSRWSGDRILITLPYSHHGYNYRIQKSADLFEWLDTGDPAPGHDHPLEWEFPLENERNFFRIVREP